ncbi:MULTISPECIES: FtsB family cell division protein [Cellulosimicrobium]|uniref:FtsB family cell division protein n=1 Tax=Cellulosimicrobium TaxID=157920 RepID=UPI001E40BD0C|nr:septum formation initiator family protein [Cellulosimicrobium sp. TH-20]
MPSSRRPPRPGAPARPGSGPARGTSGTKPTKRSASSGTASPRPASTGAPRTASGSSAKSPGGGSTARTPSSSGARRPAARPSSATSTRRAAGPAPEDRRRSRYGFLLPEVVTVRTLVLSVVVLLAAVLLLPTLRAYVNQTGELRELRAGLEQAQAEHTELEAELARWDDQAYVEREARDRLNFVMPGERPWRVLDPETVVDDTDPQTGRTITDGPVRGYEEGTPWYEAIWESVQVAGGPRASAGDDAGTPDGTAPAGEEPAGDEDAPPSGENG